MKDYYGILGIEPKASMRDIKQAYMKLAVIHHPDKGGDVELMKAITEAHTVLSDPEQRANYDADWKDSADGVDKEFATPSEAERIISHSVPFSHSFRETHQKYYQEFQTNPIVMTTAKMHLQPNPTNIYTVSIGDTIHNFDTIFKFIIFKNNNFPHHGDLSSFYIKQSFTPQLAVEIFIDFLEGDYFGQSVTAIKTYLLKASAASKNSLSKESALYQGIAEIFSIADENENNMGLLFEPLKKIHEYVIANANTNMSFCAILLQNKYYRALHAQALDYSWHNSSSVDPSSLRKFDGRALIRFELEQLQRLNGADDPTFKRLLKIDKFLYRLDKDLQGNLDAAQSAADFREHGYRALDWMPALIVNSTTPVLSNTFLQSALAFQIAAKLEDNPERKMADENLAFDLYHQSLLTAREANISSEFYSYNQCLSFIVQLNYLKKDNLELIPVIQSRCLKICDIFPVFATSESNFSVFNHNRNLLYFMRQLLHALVKIVETNLTLETENQLDIDHKYVNILYLAYEGCLKNWYESSDDPDPATQQRLRIELMQQLLSDQGKRFFDLNRNLQAPWVMVDRNEEGWLNLDKRIPIMDDINIFSSLDGIELNYQTGEISFSVMEYEGNPLDAEGVLTAYDLRELFERNVQHAQFSLDPPDPNMRYHPFNQMRIIPTALYQTDFANTLLMTDYLLKFFTSGFEVKGQQPYDMRPIQDAIKHIPEYLQNIIFRFHRSQKSESLHRFWIESLECTAYSPENNGQPDHIKKIAIPEVLMVIKKHPMAFNDRDELVDINIEDEGWNIYVVDSEANIPITPFQSPAMIFIENSQFFYFSEDNILSERKELDVFFEHQLKRLFKQKRDPNGLVPEKPENSLLLYQITKDTTDQFDKPHHFSPEYLFAQEFTDHYDAFATYFPEFARLKELTRVIAFIQVLNQINNTNNKNIQISSALLANTESEQVRISEMITDMRNDYNAAFNQDIETNESTWTQEFSRLRNIYSPAALLSAHRTHLRNIRDNIILTFSEYSAEVTQLRNASYDENKNRIIQQYGLASWNFHEPNISRQCDEQRAQIAAVLSDMARKKHFNDAYALYTPTLFAQLGPQSFISAINDFLDNNIEPLAQAVANADFATSIFVIASKNGFDTNSVRAVFDGDNSAIRRLAEQKSTRNFAQTKANLESTIASLSNRVERDKNQLNKTLTELQRLQTQLANLGIGTTPTPIDLSDQCLWVPASINHSVKDNHIHLIYGGVFINPRTHIVRENSYTSRLLTTTAFTAQHTRVPSNLLPTGNSLRYERLWQTANNITRAQAASSATPAAASGGAGSAGGGGGSSSSSSGGGSSRPPGGGNSGEGDGKGPKDPPSRPNAPDPDKKYNQAPQKLEGYWVTERGAKKVTDMTPDGMGGRRKRWELENGCIIEWDKQHGEFEMYSRGGRRHLGSFDHLTGERLKPPVPGRNIKKYVN